MKKAAAKPPRVMRPAAKHRVENAPAVQKGPIAHHASGRPVHPGANAPQKPRPHHVPLQQRVNVPLNPAARVLLLVPPQRNARRNVVRLASLPPMNSGAESRMTPS